MDNWIDSTRVFIVFQNIPSIDFDYCRCTLDRIFSFLIISYHFRFRWKKYESENDWAIRQLFPTVFIPWSNWQFIDLPDYQLLYLFQSITSFFYKWSIINFMEYYIKVIQSLENIPDTAYKIKVIPRQYYL